MKKLFHKIYNAITLNDIRNDINRLENDIDDLQKSMMENQTLIEEIEKGIAELYDDLDLES